MDKTLIPKPPDNPLPNFQLVILNETATEIVAVFDASERAGLDKEVAAALHPSGAGKSLVFSGRPDLIKAPGRQCVFFRVNDGNGWQDVFFGAVVKGWADMPMESVRSYTASAEALLNARVTDARQYAAQDPAMIALDLVKRLKHPALGVSEIDFPNTGTTLEGGFDQAGIPLGDALGLLAESVQDTGITIDYGVNASGNVFFKATSGVAATVAYDAHDYENLEVDSQDICTAVLWIIGNEASHPLTGSWQGGRTLTYLSVPDKQLHATYGAVKALAVTNPRDFFFLTPGNLIEQSGWGFPETVMDVKKGAANLGSYASRDATTSGAYIRIVNYDKATFVGGRIVYRLDYDVTHAPYFQLSQRTENKDFLSNGLSRYWTSHSYYQLPYSNEAWNTLDVFVPPYADFVGNHTVTATGELVTLPLRSRQWPDAQEMGVYQIAAAYGSVGGHFSIASLELWQLDTARLDAMAQRELNIPSKLPGQITPRRDGRPFYFAPVGKVLFTGMETERLVKPAEFRIAFNAQDGVVTVVDLEELNKNDPEAAMYDTLQLAVRRGTQLSEVKTRRGQRL